MNADAPGIINDGWPERLAIAIRSGFADIEQRHAGKLDYDDVALRGAIERSVYERAVLNPASLLALPPERRRVLVDKYVEELSVVQIAARTGKSPKAVESLLSRAREQFRTVRRWYFSDTSCRSDA